jgi:hypothetical protein
MCCQISDVIYSAYVRIKIIKWTLSIIKISYSARRLGICRPSSPYKSHDLGTVTIFRLLGLGLWFGLGKELGLGLRL